MCRKTVKRGTVSKTLSTALLHKHMVNNHLAAHAEAKQSVKDKDNNQKVQATPKEKLKQSTLRA